MPTRKKVTLMKSKVADVVETAYGEISCLAEEMDSWASGLEDRNRTDTEKYSQVDEARNSLQQGEDQPEVPEALKDVDVAYPVTTSKRGVSRAVRLADVCSQLTAVIEAVTEASQDFTDEARSEAEDFVNELQGSIDAVEGVEFPGMFG